MFNDRQRSQQIYKTMAKDGGMAIVISSAEDITGYVQAYKPLKL